MLDYSRFLPSIPSFSFIFISCVRNGRRNGQELKCLRAGTHKIRVFCDLIHEKVTKFWYELRISKGSCFSFPLSPTLFFRWISNWQFPKHFVISREKTTLSFQYFVRCWILLTMHYLFFLLPTFIVSTFFSLSLTLSINLQFTRFYVIWLYELVMPLVNKLFSLIKLDFRDCKIFYR